MILMAVAPPKGISLQAAGLVKESPQNKNSLTAEQEARNVIGWGRTATTVPGSAIAASKEQSLISCYWATPRFCQSGLNPGSLHYKNQVRRQLQVGDLSAIPDVGPQDCRESVSFILGTRQFGSVGTA